MTKRNVRFYQEEYRELRPRYDNSSLPQETLEVVRATFNRVDSFLSNINAVVGITYYEINWDYSKMKPEGDTTPSNPNLPGDPMEPYGKAFDAGAPVSLYSKSSAGLVNPLTPEMIFSVIFRVQMSSRIHGIGLPDDVDSRPPYRAQDYQLLMRNASRYGIFKIDDDNYFMTPDDEHDAFRYVIMAHPATVTPEWTPELGNRHDNPPREPMSSVGPWPADYVVKLPESVESEVLQLSASRGVLSAISENNSWNVISRDELFSEVRDELRTRRKSVQVPATLHDKLSQVESYSKVRTAEFLESMVSNHWGHDSRVLIALYLSTGFPNSVTTESLNRVVSTYNSLKKAQGKQLSDVRTTDEIEVASEVVKDISNYIKNYLPTLPANTPATLVTS